MKASGDRVIVQQCSIASTSPLTLDFLLRQGMQALEMQRRFAGASTPAGMESRIGDSDKTGSALGRMTRGGGLGFILDVGILCQATPNLSLVCVCVRHKQASGANGLCAFTLVCAEHLGRASDRRMRSMVYG